MSDKGKIEAEKHESHHRWIDDEIEEKKMCRENRQKILTHVLGWGGVSIITGLGYLLLKGLKAMVPALFL